MIVISISGCGYIEALTDETIELWTTTDDVTERSVTFEDVNLNILKIDKMKF